MKKLTKFYLRYMIYSTCILVFVFVFFTVSLWWYIEDDKWSKHGQDWFECAVQHILTNDTDNIENNCKNLQTPVVLQLIGFMLSMPVVLGGWALQITKDNTIFWKRQFKNLSTTLFGLSETEVT